MKKLTVVLLALAIASYVGWQNRLNLLVWALPKITAITQPVGPNVAIEWGRGPETAEVPVAERPPNIILVLTDDMGFNDISLYNGGAADGSLQTPNIDALANQGVRFNNGYSANAVCAPSRASILTGRYSTRFGFEFTPFPKIGATIFRWMNELEPGLHEPVLHEDELETLPAMTELGMPPSEVTLAETLHAAGYYTAHIGKWHLGSVNGMRPEDQGFEDSLYMEGMLYLPEDHPDVVNAKRPEDGIERMVWASARYAAQFNGGESFEPDGFLTDYYTREALEVINANKNRPFFLYLAHWGIHNPLQALRTDYDALSNIEDHTLRVYAAMIKSLDRSVEKITAALEANGLSENTMIVFTSDNGGAGYIALPDVNKPYRGWKLTHFEGGTHVPFMAKWPGKIKPGTVVDTPVHHIDLLPTITAAAGAAHAQPDIDGENLLPVITATEPADGSALNSRPLFWREGYQQTVRYNNWKLIRSDRPDKHWLFDLASDPTEQNNVAPQNLSRVAELVALLDTHNAAQIEPMWPSVWESAQAIDKHGGQPLEEGDEYIFWPN